MVSIALVFASVPCCHTSDATSDAPPVPDAYIRHHDIAALCLRGARAFAHHSSLRSDRKGSCRLALSVCWLALRRGVPGAIKKGI